VSDAIYIRIMLVVEPKSGENWRCRGLIRAQPLDPVGTGTVPHEVGHGLNFLIEVALEVAASSTVYLSAAEAYFDPP
jgi:hypothetical protein